MISAIAGTVALLATISFTEARADIFKWVDEQGIMHFTDDPSSIPASRRNQTATPFIKEPGASSVPETTPVAPSAIGSPPLAEPATASDSGENGTETLQREVEQLKAKISAKESLIQAVDAKRSLATNPLRNRNVSASDMDLYQKYQIELREDRDRLRLMEGRLNARP